MTLPRPDIGLRRPGIAARLPRLRRVARLTQGARCKLVAAGVTCAVLFALLESSSILLPLFLLAAFCALLWLGASEVAVAPALALALAWTGAQDDPLSRFEAQFAGPAGDFVGRFFLVFLLGAVFGRVLVDSGCATGLARAVWRGGPRWTAPLAVAGICAVMTLGGVGVFVIAFAVFPVAREIYGRAGLPLEQAPAAIALGAFTVTMTALPGAPSLTNIIAATLLGTDAFAAPVPGLVAAAVMSLLGAAWLGRVAATAGPVAAAGPRGPEPAAQPAWRAAAPLVVTVLANAKLSVAFGSGGMADAFGTWGHAYWAVVAALVLGILTAGAIAGPRAALRGLDAGAGSSIGPLLSTAAGVGFGATLAATPATAAAIAGLGAATVEGSAAFVAGVGALYAAVVGSSSGGLLLALEIHAAEFLASAELTPAEIHRFAALGAGTLDTLPHSGAVVALLAICGATHRAAYRDIFMVSVLVPIAALGAAVWLVAG